MNKVALTLTLLIPILLLPCLPAQARQSDEPKVFISVDMEGIAGLVNPESTSRSGSDYGYFRRIMSAESNAAVLGAFDAGASENGVSLPEAGINALIAGLYGVPVVFVAGDQAVCDQVTELFGRVETVAVKQGIGAASEGLHPEVANTRIRAGVADAVSNRSGYRPFTMTPPYTMVLKLKSEASVYNGSFFPGARRTGDWELTFTSEDLLQVIYAFNVMNRKDVQFSSTLTGS